jgi:signal transduction histidine kinase
MTVNLYRVVQEALSNVARHAGASVVRVRLAVAPDLLTLTIQDDGRGFLVPAHLGQLTAEGHFGLTGIQERVDLIGGSLEVTSAPGQGTTLRVRRDSSTVAQ